MVKANEHRRSRLTAALAATLLLASCSLLEPEEWRRVVGVIDIGDELSVPAVLPEHAVTGIPFTATIVTYGSSSCTRADGADVEVAGLEAEITPYDLDYRGPWTRGRSGVVCTDDLASHPREISLRFDEPGEAEVRVFGRSLVGDGMAEFRFTIPVHP